MLRSLFYIIICLALANCGQEQGAEARLHKKTEITPANVVSRAQSLLPSKNKKDETSISSQVIRQDTLGFRVKSTPGANGTTDLRIEHFENYDNGKCRNNIHDITGVTAKQLLNWVEINTLQVRCLDNNCGYMMIIIHQSAGSFVDGTGSLVNGYVPLILEKKENGGTYFEPTLVSTSPFIKLSVNTICTGSDQVVRYPMQVPVSPIDGPAEPNYNYFPDQYNNSWIY